MILGIDRHPAAECFRELDDALTAMGRSDVVLNAHAFPDEIPPGAVVYNLENVGIQVQTDAFQGHELWDFSARNCETWRAAGRTVTHVPVGYHTSMTRFEMLPWDERDIDVVFTGCVNERRAKVLQQLVDRGLVVRVIGPGECYGAERDAILARSKVALNMLYDERGTFPVLRAAHTAANGLATVNEIAPETPEWATRVVPYEGLADECMLVAGHEFAKRNALITANVAGNRFRETCLDLPKPNPLTDPRWDIARTGGDLAAMYDAARGGPVSETPLVAVVVPSYRETESVARHGREARNAIRVALGNAGIPSLVTHASGDALVCRMRQRATHAFLMTSATHMLFIDADIECLTPDCVVKMLGTGHDVIAGACPFKDMTGRTVHNLWEDGLPKVDAQGCVEVRDAGTGFLLISRKAILQMQNAHPELLHWSMSMGEDRGVPLWALFDTAIVGGIYQSEDFYFAHLWQELGGKVYCYTPARFRHWGEHGYEASFEKQYGLDATEDRS